MKRNLSELDRSEFDLAIVGGGVFGACAACDAAQRGLSVVLIERGDFSGSTSANSYKLVHGGIRYLQHVDIYRVRQSSTARRTLLRIAPHLVHPLPIVVPTYGKGMKSKWAMRAAMSIYDGLTSDRNRGIADPARHIPPGRCLSRSEIIEQYPGINPEGLTGAAVFCDGQMHNPPRLVLAFLQSAVGAGAVVANYVEAKRFVVENYRATGIEARDVLNGGEFKIRARCVLNATGPYAEGLLECGLGRSLSPPTHWSRDAYFIVPRPLICGPQALALPAKTKDPGAHLTRGSRHLFLTPWRDHTLVGVWHKVYRGHPDAYHVSADELQLFVDEINGAYGGLNLTMDDISAWHAGLIPFGVNSDPRASDLRFGHRSRLIDHRKQHGIDGLLTLIGVRFTTGPHEAVRTINLVLRKLGKTRCASKLHVSPLDGGSVDDFAALVTEVASSGTLSRETAEALVHNHGANYRRVLAHARRRPEWAETIASSKTLKAEVVHAVREEMAQTLTDVVLRRTELGTGAYPGRAALLECAQLMANELEWDTPQTEGQVDQVVDCFPASMRRAKNAIRTEAARQRAEATGTK